MKRPDDPSGSERRRTTRLILGVVATVIGLGAGACRQAARTSNTVPTRRALPALTLDDSLRPALLAVGRAALNDALNRAHDTAAVCVVFEGPDRGEFRPEAADLRTLAESGERRDRPRRFVSIANCPRTYTSMILTVDSHGNPVDPPPRGYVDPHILSIVVPERWVPKADERSITVIVRVAQGTVTDEYLCRVRPASARAAMLPVEGSSRRLTEAATCRLDKQYIS